MADHPAPPSLVTALYWHRQIETPARQNGQLSLSLGELTTAARLREAWDKVAATNPLLRSGFYQMGRQGYVLRETGASETKWQEIDWSQTNPAEIPTLWENLQADELSRPFALENPPLVRGAVINLPGGHCHLLATFPRFLLDEDELFGFLRQWLLTIDGYEPSPTSLPALVPVETASTPWWSQYLTRASKPLELAILPRPQSPGTESHKISELLTRDYSQRIRELAEHLGAGTYDVFHGMAALVLGRMAGASDVLWLANGASDTNLLPARISLEGEAVWENWLKKLARSDAERAIHSTLDLSQVLAMAPSDLKYPDFTAAFQWSPNLLADRLHDDLPRWINVDAKLARAAVAPLTFEVRDGRRFAIDLHFDSSLWAEDEMARVLERFHLALDSVLENPAQKLKDIPLLASDELELLERKSQGGSLHQPAKRIEERIVETALRQPDQLAVQGEGDVGLSFAEVNSHAHSLAAYLRHENLADGWVIAICLTPTPWLPVATLGILLARDTCVPLDAEASPAWLAEKAAGCDAELVLCDSKTALYFEGTSRRILIIDQNWENIASVEATEAAGKAPKAAFLLTGTEKTPEPELKILSARLVSSACKEAISRWRLKPGDRVPLLMAPGTGAFIETLLSSLLAGATIVLPPESRSPLSAWMEGATHLRLTAPQFRQLALDLRREKFFWPESARAVCVESGWIPRASLDAWRAAAGESVSLHVYWSPANLSGFGLRCSLKGSPIDQIPLGFPTAGISAHLFDACGQVLPPHLLGEAEFQSAEDTNLKWLLPAWRDEEGLFYTDDRENGAQSTLSRLPGVLDVHIARLPGQERSAAWIISEATELPKIPSLEFILPVEDFPLTSCGRVDEDKLPKPAGQTAPKPAERPAAVSPTPAAPILPTRDWEPLKVLCKTADLPVLVLVHDLNGDPDAYATLAPLLKEDWSIYGTEAKGRHQPGNAHQSVEAEAASLVEALCAMDPEGPYHLAGCGYGAILAYEMARQLRIAGRTVPYLALAGSPPPQLRSDKTWMRSLTRIFSGATKKSAAASTPVASAHEKALQDYRAEMLQGPAGIILGADLGRDVETAWLACAPEAFFERMSSASAQMLTEPAVKRLAALLREWTIAGGEDDQ